MKKLIIKLTDSAYRKVINNEGDMPVQIREAIRRGISIPKRNNTKTYELLGQKNRIVFSTDDEEMITSINQIIDEALDAYEQWEDMKRGIKEGSVIII